jgi:hypothetical protein
MTTLVGLTTQPKQQIAFVLPDGSQVSMLLQYRPQQMGWFFDLTWQNITINGGRLACFPNILRQWRNLLPFGLACVTNTGSEPLNLADLADGTILLVVLSSDDLVSIEAAAFPGN